MADITPQQTGALGLTLQPVDFDPFAPIPETQDGQRLALTSSQREVFAAVQLSPDASAAFNLCNILLLHGPLDLDALRKALEQVVQRHAALRTSIAADGSVQLIHAQVPVELSHEALGALARHDAERALVELAEHEAAGTLDLQTAPLWRARVLSWGDQQHALVFNAHHIISDGWSFSVLFGDWALAYTAQVEGHKPHWREHLPYDVFVQQQLSLECAALERADLAYWQARHMPLAAPLALPVDRARPPLKTFACSKETVVLSAALAQGLRTMAARQGCTLFVTLLASFQALLARLCGQSDLVLGVPLALQTQLENPHLVADGANTVPLRQTVSVDQAFADVLKATRRNLLDAHQHARLSFGNLVRTMHLPRDPSRTPLVDVIFNLDRSAALPDFGAAKGLRLDSAKVASNSELTVDVVDDGQQLVIHLRYLKALFEPSTLRRWLASWQQALRLWTADPQLMLADALLPTTDERALLDGFNATSRAFPGPQRLEALFAEQALRTPHLPAVWCSGRPTTYAQLDAMANGVAYALQAEGVVPGSRVGLYCGRDATMVAAVLGILKAGAAYVPLDLALPVERVAFMVSDAGLRWVLCDESSLAKPDWADVRKLDLRRCPPREQAPSWPLHADDPAYVIYTSGSTGRPKGVVVAHRSVSNFIHSVQMQPGMRASERHAAVATLSFDMSVMDLFLPLSVGACLVVIAREDLEDGPSLARRLAESAATSLQAAPSIWRLLIDSGWRGSQQFRALCGGEALPVDLARALVQRCAEVWNLYGPTETSVYSTVARVEDPSRGIRVGLPVANTQVHVLDERLRPVPLGSVGEICIGGEGLALGYLNQADLTAQRFVADPERPGHRMYRTGDLGRWHVDGGLECLGRNDQQLKLRGWRIEPAEIETCLLSQPGVRQAFVHGLESMKGRSRVDSTPPPGGGGVLLAPPGGASDATPGHWALCAYVVCSEVDFDAAALRAALRRQLPEVMVPAYLIRLDAMPLLPNGKIDRQALPDPLGALAAASHKPAPGLSVDEQRVADVWCRLLGISQVSPSDNFFDLGGHSLLAAQAAVQMSQVLGFKVDVPRLLMESLAQVVRRPEPALQAPSADQAAASRLASWMKRWTASRSGL